jgi:hypothetical protein
MLVPVLYCYCYCYCYCYWNNWTVPVPFCLIVSHLVSAIPGAFVSRNVVIVVGEEREGRYVRAVE